MGEPKRRRSSKYCLFRPVEDITDDDLENVAITVKDKIYDKVLVGIHVLLWRLALLVN